MHKLLITNLVWLVMLIEVPYSLAGDPTSIDWNISYTIGKFELRTDCEGYVDNSPCLLIFGTPGSIVERELTDWNNYAVSLSTPPYHSPAEADCSPRTGDDRPLEELIKHQALFSFFNDEETTTGVAVFNWSGTGTGRGGATHYFFDTETGFSLSVDTDCWGSINVVESGDGERYVVNYYDKLFLWSCGACDRMLAALCIQLTLVQMRKSC